MDAGMACVPNPSTTNVTGHNCINEPIAYSCAEVKACEMLDSLRPYDPPEHAAATGLF